MRHPYREGAAGGSRTRYASPYGVASQRGSGGRHAAHARCGRHSADMNRQAIETLGPVAINLPPKRRHALRRYGLAVAFASVALLIRGALPVPQGTSIYLLPLAAVVLSGWFGGRAAGLVALVICAAGILYWFIAPANSVSLPLEYAARPRVFF